MAVPASLWSRFIVCRNSDRGNRKVDIARIAVRNLRYGLGVAGSFFGEILAADRLKEQSMLTFCYLVRKTT